MAPHIMESSHQESSSHVGNRDQSNQNHTTPVREMPEPTGNVKTPTHVTGNAQPNQPTAPSFGLTPFLSQFQRDPSESPMSFQVPSAVPSPLNSRTASQTMAMPKDPLCEIITGFHVLHFHIDQANDAAQTTTRQSQDEIFAYVASQVDDIKNVMNEQYTDLRSNMDAVEHNVGRSGAELEKVKKAIETFNVNLDEQVMKPMKTLADKNDQVCSVLGRLDEMMQRFEKKLDDVVKMCSASQDDNVPGPSPPAQTRRSYHGPPPGIPLWNGYDNARQMVMGNQGGGQMPYTQIGQSYYNGGDSAQHPNYQGGYYNASHGHGYGHSRSNSNGNGNGAGAGPGNRRQ
ncbi:hypothetical protein IWX90DRAFT_94196 [Phyllosticta citrichinensis]|uniref:Uncharacterized protein n=1 Tax=Phyllosticta citrichinensis TaxID=1130410 RepID=A0ABR1XF02_9PEZI